MNSSRAAGQYNKTTSNLDARIALHAFGTNPQDWFGWLATRLPVAGDVLEVGAGTGLLWSHFPGRTPTLTDFSPAMCARLRTVPGARVVRCDAVALPFPDATFDTVIANHMLYHLDDPDAGLRELTRVLRPTGNLAVTTNGEDHVAELNALRPDGSAAHHNFTAETAPSRIARRMTNVHTERYPCDLEIPEPAPILAYLESQHPLTPTQRTAITKRIETHLTTTGTFHIRKHTVLITATR